MRLLLLLISIYACNIFPYKTGNHLPIKDSTMVKLTDKIRITVGSKSYGACLENNATAKAFVQLLPLTITMTELNENEKYYDLPKSLPTNSSNPKTIDRGDLRLYGSNTLVLFYKSFPTSYSYTKIGKIDNPEGLAKALGRGNVDVTFELE